MFSNNNQQSRRMSSKRLHFVLLTTIVENAGISAFFFLSLSSTCTFIKHCTFPAAAPPFFELESIDCRREKNNDVMLFMMRPPLSRHPTNRRRLFTGSNAVSKYTCTFASVCDMTNNTECAYKYRRPPRRSHYFIWVKTSKMLRSQIFLLNRVNRIVAVRWAASINHSAPRSECHRLMTAAVCAFQKRKQL